MRLGHLYLFRIIRCLHSQVVTLRWICLALVIYELVLERWRIGSFFLSEQRACTTCFKNPVPLSFYSFKAIWIGVKVIHLFSELLAHCSEYVCDNHVSVELIRAWYIRLTVPFHRATHIAQYMYIYIAVSNRHECIIVNLTVSI